MSRFIHLLYVPTMNCNMQCKYCYLGDNTVDTECDRAPVETLEFAVEKFRLADVVPFNISLHGGEVTTLSREDFREIVKYIDGYYKANRELLKENVFRVGSPHIKTNLFGIDKHIDTIRDYSVSISGSLDLPLSLHKEYRVTKGGNETLTKILGNISLLSELPNRKKVSATIFKEHFDRIDDICEDIKYLHENTCLDMNDFNFMIGFDSSPDSDVRLTPLDEDRQVQLFRRMNDEFTGTDLQNGLDNAWFAEFTQYYCTNCDICGEKFFLLEKNGDIYSCVRGQGHPDFFYGNIYTDTVDDILDRAVRKIYDAHRSVGFDEKCASCDYLHLCKTGCPFVKKVYSSPTSYTCRLQQEIYKKNNEQPGGSDYPSRYFAKLYPELMEKYSSLPDTGDENSPVKLIGRDEKLKKVYDDKAFIIYLDGEEMYAESQLLKTKKDILFLSDLSDFRLFIRKDVLEALSDYPVNNSLYMMLLSGDMVIYGDEQREKQEHVMTHQIFRGTLEKNPSSKDGFYCVDLIPVLKPYFKGLSKENPNNLFFTTSDLRDYHYTKQKNNGFYHIAALNLPFQNIEFYYVDIEEGIKNGYYSSEDL